MTQQKPLNKLVEEAYDKGMLDALDIISTVFAYYKPELSDYFTRVISEMKKVMEKK